MPPGFFFARNAPQTSPRGNRTSPFIPTQKKLPRYGARRIFNGRFLSLEKVRPARRLSTLSLRLPAKLRRGNRSSQRRSAPTAKTDKGPTLRSLPTANADIPPAGTNAPAGLLRKQMRAPTPFTPAHAHAAARNTCRERHPQGNSASFPVQKQASAASKIFHDAILK